MRTKLVQIGNSKGVRLPKAVLDEVGLVDEIDLVIRRGELVLRPRKPLPKLPPNPRAGWEEAFRRAGPPPELTSEERAWLEFPNEFDKSEWTW